MQDTKANYTLGPWQVISGAVYTADPRYTDEEQVSIARMDRDTQDTLPCERDANARLIAAAPELLDALKAIVADDRLMENFRSPSSVTRYLIEQAREAIAKAQGE